jgi:hypothetical protein
MTMSRECPNIKLISRLLLPVILGVLTVGSLFLILGGLFGVTGALLVYFGTKAAAHVHLFGPRFEITNIGILSLFLAGIIVVTTIERMLKRVHELNAREGINFLDR